MQQTVHSKDKTDRRRTDPLLRDIMLVLFAGGFVALSILWAFEAHFGLLDALCRIAYPTMLAVFSTSAWVLYRWPQTLNAACWIVFLAINALFFMQFVTALRSGAPLVGNYPFISILIWLPLAYAMSLLMLDIRRAPWAAGAMFIAVAATSIKHVIESGHTAPDDLALLINVFASHLVLLACLSGLIKFKLALAKADADSHALLEQASTDPLTGLANRRYGLKMLRRAAQVPCDETFSAIMLCDIDRFKEINDLHGHDTGDHVVQCIASMLRNNTRDVDTVVRWGGDEYLVVIPRIGAPALAELAERLCVRTRAIRIDLGESSITPQISLGVAARLDGEDIEAWIKRADLALYQAKSGGRNCYAFAHPPAAAALPPFAAGANRGGSATPLQPLLETE